MTEPERGPVFICGADRSGTSLMFALLSSHPNLSMVRRTNMWRWFYRSFDDLGEPKNLDRMVDTMARYRRLDQLSPDWDRVRSEFESGAPTYGRFFDLLHRHHAERVGRPRWGDKSLHSEYYADAIFEEFPDARVVHLIRDPRDRCASILNRYERSSKGIGAITGRWLNSARWGERNRRRYQDGYRVVRYEDLARNPKEVVAATCEFLGEEFVPEMMDMVGAPEHAHGNSSFGSMEPGTISTKSIGRYQAALDATDVAFIHLTSRRVMSRYGYDLGPVDLDGLARVRFALRSAPQDLARMGGWMFRERWNRNRLSAPQRRLSTGADIVS